ncbi:sigma 54-interacting transcriptional regulator [Clostridium oryzae]|uniref:Nif-specific regulatory protein n=1 Tax=Clostridium oryzae TaxID=1450648 RepID=A0A1V4ILP3_9CLOT|nr:sigma-54-dependent transcriptional regulator [Clostridium oryzae]OPJ60397.1 Nif-specific regulatory protein [Clostridium oryzae]
MLKEDTLKYLYDNTKNYEKGKENEVFTAQHISKVFNVKRNTISHYINKMIEDNEVIKVNTRPVYFFHKKAFEEKFFKVSKNIFSSLDELFYNDEELEDRKEIFDKLIGSKGSLKQAVEQIKTSIFYPTNGLPIMLSGPTGVGKSYTASLIHKYSIQCGVLPEDAPFIAFNCAQYYNNPELLSSNLFGYIKGAFTGADKNQGGMLEAADGGILFLDEVHRLNSEGQEKLFTFMDQGVVRRMGETEGWHKVKVRLIFATTESLSENFLDTFLRRVPITVSIPGLDERDDDEKNQFVYNFLINESKTFNKDILISQRAAQLLALHKYKGNIGELQNTIKYICAAAYSKNVNSDRVQIKLKDLPEKLIKEAVNNTSYKIKHEKDILITPESELDDLYINEKTSLQNIKNTYKQIFDLYKSYIRIKNKEQFENDVFLEINSLIDKLIFEKNKYNENVMLQFITSSLHDVINYVEYSYNIRFNGNSIYIIAYFLYAKGYDVIKWNSDTEKIRNQLYNYILANNREECDLVSKLSKLISSKMDVNLSKDDEIFLSLYLKSLSIKKNSNAIKAVILAHGYATASSISSVVNRMLERNVFEPFDMPIDISMSEIVEKLIEYIEENDVSNGLVILVDMGSLKDIYLNIKDYINVPIAIVNNVSTQMALFVGDLLNKNIYLEELIEKLKASNVTQYKIIYPEISKEKAIITSCITGIGTAKQLQALLEKSIPKELGIHILVNEYERLKTNGTKEALFQLYDVLAILGTTNPEVEQVEYISLEDLISGRGEDKLYKIFDGIADEDTIRIINNNIIRNFSLKSVVGSVTILDTNKILENIEICLNNLEVIMGKRLPNNKKVALYVHISCLVERLIRNAPIKKYRNLDEFVQCQKDMINNIKKAFSVIEEIYNVKINMEEIGYIYDILTSPMGDSEEF